MKKMTVERSNIDSNHRSQNVIILVIGKRTRILK